MAGEPTSALWPKVRSIGAQGGARTVRPRSLLAALLSCFRSDIDSQIGFTLTFQLHPVAVLWPPTSILLAALPTTVTFARIVITWSTWRQSVPGELNRKIFPAAMVILRCLAATGCATFSEDRPAGDPVSFLAPLELLCSAALRLGSVSWRLKEAL